MKIIILELKKLKNLLIFLIKMGKKLEKEFDI
jgi:hypothetical protein